MTETEEIPVLLDIVLASASPRRRQLLEDAGVDFRIHVVDVDESLEPDLVANPLEAVKKLAERKGHAAVEELLEADYVGDMVVIASDTMVVLNNKIFGKPKNADDARVMLHALSGATHQVMTAVSLWVIHAPAEEDLGLMYRTFVDVTQVTFRDLSDEEIDEYIATGDPFDKAGAYGIQGGAKGFVYSLDGNLDTVIGLPVQRLLKEFPFLKEGVLS